MIVIIDYSMGNVQSVMKKIKAAGIDVVVTDQKEIIEKAEKIILPGVGHFNTGMKNLIEKGLDSILYERVIYQKVPVLGICLGMQLFCSFSEEGNAKGLGWLDARTQRFRQNNPRFKVPHIGWNSLKIKRKSTLFSNINPETQFYFVHSYHLVTDSEEDILATSHYGYEFISAIQRDNIYGVQFHPEKSHSDGETVLRNFLKI
jgi:glutamine amidotransferase